GGSVCVYLFQPIEVTMDAGAEPFRTTCETTAEKPTRRLSSSQSPAGPPTATDVPPAPSSSSSSIFGLIMGFGMRNLSLGGDASERPFQPDAADSISLPPVDIEGGLAGALRRVPIAGRVV